MNISAESGPKVSRHEQGKWGSACSVCSSAKAKCIRSDRASGAPCDRCRRLSKECTDQVHLPRKKRTTQNTRTSQLEERLNGLVDLLRASGELPTESRPVAPRQATSRNNDDTPRPISPSASVDGQTTIRIPPAWNASCPPRCVCGATHGDVKLAPTSDEDALKLYQTQLMPHFPFVVVPTGIRADQLAADRPFLFASIKMAASVRDVRSMRGQMYWLVDQVTKGVVISSARSMDLLQAVLVMLAWFHNHCVMHAQFHVLLHLAQALMTDMGLNNEMQVQERTNAMVLAPHVPPPRQAEDIRAVLGVWFLTSSAYSMIQKILPMRFTKYFKRCLEQLEEAPEVASDQLLVQLIKIQRLTEQVHTFMSEELEEHDVHGLPRAPASAYLSVYDGELQRLQHSLPPELKGHEFLKVLYASATLRLRQPPPIELGVLKDLVESFTTFDPDKPSTIDTLYRAKAALQGFFDTFLALPADLYPVMPMYIMVNILVGATMLARWAKVMGPVQARPQDAVPDILTPQKVIWDPSAQRPSPRTIFGGAFFPTAAPEDKKRHGPTPGGNRAPLGPLKTAGGGWPDPSAAAAAAAAAASSSSSSPPPPSRLDGIPPPITDPTQIAASHIRETSDPDIPHVLAALRARLRSQPGLNLDMVGIFTTLAQRCEQAHRDLESQSHGGGSGGGGRWQNDIWYICCKKVLIARAKLEKFAEIVAAGSQQEKTAQKAGRDDETSGSSSSSMAMLRGDLPAQPVPSASVTAAPTTTVSQLVDGPAENTHLPGALFDEAIYDSFWMDNAFDPLHPSLWLVDDGDWNMELPAEATGGLHMSFS